METGAERDWPEGPSYPGLRLNPIESDTSSELLLVLVLRTSFCTNPGT